MTTIGIVDYGLGNLTSVAGAVERVEAAPVVSSDPKALRDTDKLILPGVGAFGDGMAKLRERGLVEPLKEMAIDGGKPILGICLGCQLMTRASDEFGQHEGLGWFETETVRFAPEDTQLRVPHVGWDELEITGECTLYESIEPGELFYYVHSHYVRADGANGAAVGMCNYDVRFAAVLHRDNLYATQFHPEKSQRAGLAMLRNFVEKG